MKKNKYKIIIIFTALILFFLFTENSFALTAKDAGNLLNTSANKAGVGGFDPIKVVTGVVQAVFSLVGLIFFIFMFYGGYQWFVAQGNEEKVTVARKTLMTASIGLIVVVGSFSITNFIFDRVISRTTVGNSSLGLDPTAGPDSYGCCLLGWRSEGSGGWGIGVWTGNENTGQKVWESVLLPAGKCEVSVYKAEYQKEGETLDLEEVESKFAIKDETMCRRAADLKNGVSRKGCCLVYYGGAWEGALINQDECSTSVINEELDDENLSVERVEWVPSIDNSNDCQKRASQK